MQAILDAYNKPAIVQNPEQIHDAPGCSFMENVSEILEMLQLLKKHQADLLINHAGKEQGVSYPDELNMENRPDRLRMNDLIYRGEVVPDFLVLLPSGRWNHNRLTSFLGLKSPAARARGEREGKR